MRASRLGRRARQLAAAAALLPSLSCSSGLEGLDSGDTEGAAQPARSTNLRFGFDPLVALTDPIEDVAVAGGVIPTTDGSRERPVAFFAFVTRTVIPDVDDPTTDTNGVEDVFVAAVDSNSVDPFAFDYSIAGTMRHPRCVTCHQMNIDVAQDPEALPPTPFLTQPHFTGGGLPPLNEFDDANCEGCHFSDWLAPGPTFDLRREGTRDLFVRAQTPPGGLEEHFRTDTRVLWALDRGDTPFGGAADDDHDGVDEPEDHDGIRRHVPGGKAAFLERLDGWLATADPLTGELKFSSAQDALQDMLLASRATGGVSQAANGPSRSPSPVYEPTPAFDPANPTVAPAGFLHLAFQSDASNMVGGTTNGFTDVFKVTIAVLVSAQGELNLSFQVGTQVCISAAAGGGDSKGNSTDPDIGASGRRVAFVSEAFNLVAGLPSACRPEVYLWDEVVGNTLISHVPGAPLTPGDAGAINPDLSPDGEAVCFESDATNLVAGDTNGARDVFFARFTVPDVERASVTDAGGEFTGHSHQGSIFHDSGNVKVAFANRDTALPPVLGVQCPDEVVVLTAVRDTHMRAGTPAGSFAGSDLFVGTTGGAGDGQRRGLVLFDFGVIPAGATINSASMSLVLNREPDGTGADCPVAGGIPNSVNLHRVTQDWAENATWNDRMPGIPWATAGGTFVAGSSALQVVQGTGT